MSAKKTLPAIVWKEGHLFVAKLVGFELASQGETKKEALQNLKEALDLYLEDEGAIIPSSQIPQKLEVSNIVYA
jgi:predicted RNase H-like HicB family nuclease